ncbi:MAG: hypothetical protein LBR52_07290 [Prevotellaceae bacterium]|jgi:hypothetical protein|nr:hypothetical protein [Prevotellaceae bacterium]
MKYNILTGIILLFVIVLKISLMDVTFFWDAITCLSLPARFFYENKLQTFVYSGWLDNGDPHVIPYLLAIVWTLFGKNLIISHLMFLPVVAGAVFQIILLCKKTLAPNCGKSDFIVFFFGCLLVLADPSILTQLLLLGIDLWVIFFAIYAVNQMLCDKKAGLSLAFIGLCLTNKRGMIIAATLMIVYVLKIFLLERRAFSVKEFTKIILPTLPGCFTVFIYLLFRFYYHGWVFTNVDSAWAGTGNLVDFYGFIRNCAAFVWRNLDFGRIGLWAVMLFMLVKFGYKRLFNSETCFLWLSYFLLQFSFACVTLTITNPFGARYFVVQFILFAILTVKLVFDLFDEKHAKIIASLLIVISVTGNLWLYPEKIAKNWDCTLKHLPFYSLRKECFDYMEKHEIAYEQTASGFCLYGDQRNVDLMNKERIIQSILTEETRFFLYSNISNLEDELIDELNNSEIWTNIKTFESGGIFIRVLSKNKEQK